ncbi:hypothetical protein MMC12_008148 [Toensbergia leucococca]|nr:hypothetical protein [Toensbergia leucococca]
MPNFPRGHNWDVPLLQHRNFGIHSEASLEASSAYKNIASLGGGKSAANMDCALAKAGKDIEWLVRKSGGGLGIFVNAAANGRYRDNGEAQAIWAMAFWDGHVTIPRFKQAQREVEYKNAFSRRRHPTRGIDGFNFHTDLIWYTDNIFM